MKSVKVCNLNIGPCMDTMLCGVNMPIAQYGGWLLSLGMPLVPSIGSAPVKYSMRRYCTPWNQLPLDIVYPMFSSLVKYFHKLLVHKWMHKYVHVYIYISQCMHDSNIKCTHICVYICTYLCGCIHGVTFEALI